MLANYAQHMSLMFPSNNIILSQESSPLIDGIRITDDGLILVVIDKSDLISTAIKFLGAFISDFERNT